MKIAKMKRAGWRNSLRKRPTFRDATTGLHLEIAKMRPEKRAKNFNADNLSILVSGWCF